MTELVLLKSEFGVKLWRVSLRAPHGTAMNRYLVKRAPEDWLFATLEEAEKHLDEEVIKAKQKIVQVK